MSGSKKRFSHELLERNVGLLIIFSILVVSFSGLVQIIPLFFQHSTTTAAEGVKPYEALRLVGRDVYIREGCVGCHSQQIRKLQSEVQRYGPYSIASESVYDHPFLWGSKRTGPDLARVGGRYSNEWQVQHLTDPRSVVPESIMPSYSFLARATLDFDTIGGMLQANANVGVPYTPEMIQSAAADLIAQATPDADSGGVLERYPKAVVGGFDGDAMRITEMDALVAYLQVLGTLVDFNTYDAAANAR